VEATGNMNKKISVVIPIYYNAGSLPSLFSRLETLEENLLLKNCSLELIFVDDGSEDSSLNLLLEFKKKRSETKVVKLTRNFGAAKSSKTGLKFVTGDAFVILAADLQDPPELILTMSEKWLSGAKFVICERSSRDDPLFSKLFASIYYKLVRTLVIKNFPKGGYDLALMDKDFLPYLVNSSKSTVPSLLGFWLGFKPEIVPYHRELRKYDKSRWTFSKKLTLFLDVILGFSITPIRAISLLGLIVSILSFSYGGIVVIGGLMNKMPIEGYASIVALITFLLGLIIIMLGFISEYLWRIFDELNKRPEAIIEEVW
jgi:polyisoprenyl-phosphate glycosyltransferase